MKKRITAYSQILDSSGYADIIDPIDHCPVCKKSGDPNILNACFIGDPQRAPVQIAYQCRDPKCNTIFIAQYNRQMTERMEAEYYLRYTFPKFFEKILFSSEINQISSLFGDIYNQSKMAEELELDQIAGAGYRKSLEFLIKDYLIYSHPKKKEIIKNKWLGKCIEEIESVEIKECAKRAAWLGNDETHYYRRFETKDIEDMKNYIDLVVAWITLKNRTEKSLKDMPE